MGTLSSLSHPEPPEGGLGARGQPTDGVPGISRWAARAKLRGAAHTVSSGGPQTCRQCAPSPQPPWLHLLLFNTDQTSRPIYCSKIRVAPGHWKDNGSGWRPGGRPTRGCAPRPTPSGSPALLRPKSQSLPWPCGRIREGMDLLQNGTCFSLKHPFSENLLRVSPLPSTVLGVGDVAMTKTDRKPWSSHSKREGGISFLGGQCQARGGSLCVFDEQMGGGSIYNHSRSELAGPRCLSSVPQTLLSPCAGAVLVWGCRLG